MSLRFIREFIKLETSAGIILFLTALLAMVIDNTSLSYYYEIFFHTPIKIFIIEKPLLMWINDGFMSIFFLLIGLEIKREMLEGELNSVAKSSLPAIAAMGGMLFPATIYIFSNWHDPLALKGWAIPTATDIAFSLAILSLLGNRIPVSIKIFLTALAIFDDIGAIIIIAIFYTSHISLILLLCAILFIAILLLLNYFNVQCLSPYLLVGFILWLCVLKSGVHATLAGIILALFIPMKNSKNIEKSPLRILEQKLHPWVAFGILPVFAFANAGISFSGMTWQSIISPMPLGIILGLFLGKQLGICTTTLLAVRLRIAQLPKDITHCGLYGMSLVAGIGFTMSLFIGTLAFDAAGFYAVFVRVGVMVGSFLSGLLGYWILRLAYSKNKLSV